jgi:hypothetical protein
MGRILPLEQSAMANTPPQPPRPPGWRPDIITVRVNEPLPVEPPHQALRKLLNLGRRRRA